MEVYLHYFTLVNYWYCYFFNLLLFLLQIPNTGAIQKCLVSPSKWMASIPLICSRWSQGLGPGTRPVIRVIHQDPWAPGLRRSARHLPAGSGCPQATQRQRLPVSPTWRASWADSFSHELYKTWLTTWCPGGFFPPCRPCIRAPGTAPTSLNDLPADLWGLSWYRAGGQCFRGPWPFLRIKLPFKPWLPGSVIRYLLLVLLALKLSSWCACVN